MYCTLKSTPGTIGAIAVRLLFGYRPLCCPRSWVGVSGFTRVPSPWDPASASRFLFGLEFLVCVLLLGLAWVEWVESICMFLLVVLWMSSILGPGVRGLICLVPFRTVPPCVL